MTAKSRGIRPDQETRLAEIEEALLDVFIEEADPAGWMSAEKAEEEARKLEEAGDGKAAAKARSGWKGERYWEKKNANQTMALLTRIVCHRKALSDTLPVRPGGFDADNLKKDMADAQAKVTERLRLARTKIKLVKR